MVKNSQKTAFAGQEIAFDDQTKLILKLPKKACIRLIYDGQLVWECNKQELVFDKLDKGKYRVEVYFKDKPWIFSNCIKIY
jgi:hypothetical protein